MYDELQKKIKTLNELMWERHVPWSIIEQWLSHFAPSSGTGYDERTHALFLLSNFSYFNSTLMRVLLRSLYRDLVQYPIVSKLRKRQRNTLDWSLLQPSYNRALSQIRFVGMGNPSESGTHLLYYFRQENQLPTGLFVHHHELFEGSAAAPRLTKGVKHVIFLDDFCGSGTQATRYSKGLLSRLCAVSPKIQLSYLPLFATSTGLKKVRESTRFTSVQTICELDESFRALEPTSRYFREPRDAISREFAATMCELYGSALEPDAPVGFGHCQLLLGFAHNIPNNSLPVFWSDGNASRRWAPIFHRYRKGAGW